MSEHEINENRRNKRRRSWVLGVRCWMWGQEPHQHPTPKTQNLLRLFRLFSFISCFLLLYYQSYSSSPMPDGAGLFAANCAKCHGQDGRGIPKYLKKGQKDFTDIKWQKSRTDAQLTKTIADGKGEYMPPWKDKFSAEEIKALVDKIRDLGKEK
jgi:cytochrome c5